QVWRARYSARHRFKKRLWLACGRRCQESGLKRRAPASSASADVNKHCHGSDEAGDNCVFQRFHTGLILQKVLDRFHFPLLLIVCFWLAPNGKLDRAPYITPELKASSQET